MIYLECKEIENMKSLIASLNAFNPVHHLGHPGVDSWRISTGTSDTPRDNTHLDSKATLFQVERTARITL